jgi:hypothetical protein
MSPAITTKPRKAHFRPYRVSSPQATDYHLLSTLYRSSFPGDTLIPMRLLDAIHMGYEESKNKSSHRVYQSTKYQKGKNSRVAGYGSFRKL